jgi:iron complex outermembrane receptor protein
VSGAQAGAPVTPKFGVSYQVNDENMMYASAGKGYRVGGASAPLPSLASCQAAVAQLGFSPGQYQSDSVWSYEVGSKDRLANGKAQIDSSIFWIDWSNIQQFLALPACNYLGVTANLGRAVSKGFDTQLTVRATDHITTGLSVAYTHANFVQQVGTGTSTLINNGDTLGLAPWSLTGSADFNFSLLGRAAYVHLDDEFHSHNSGPKASLDDPNALTYDPNLPLNPSTNQLNARAGVKLAGVDVSLFANNILDAHPLLNRWHDSVGSTTYYDFTLRPLTVGVTAVLSF